MRQIDKSRIYDQQLFRQVYFMSNIGPSALPPDQLDRVKTSCFINQFTTHWSLNVVDYSTIVS